MNSKLKTFLTILITAIVTFVLTISGVVAIGILSLFTADSSFSEKIEGVASIIESKYLYDYDKEMLEESAIKAYVDALEEPYTEYYTAEEFKDYTESIEDGYTGIGVIVSINDENQIVVIAPIDDSPAYKAGITGGDILKAVDGREYKGEELNDAVNVIKGGKAGTNVDITIVRDGEEINLTIERGEIVGDSVKSEMLSDNIGYIRITQFNTSGTDSDRTTSSEFDEQLEKLENEGMEKLIIDLRDNPGGVLPEVCAVADKLLGEGVITYTEDKNGNRETYSSDADMVDVPIVVLINGNSASASEILTGALKDYGRATVVGEKSFGKGIVQDVFMLRDGSGFSITTANYYTPNGVCIHDVGIEPDVQVETGSEYENTHVALIKHEDDNQLKKAIEIIKEK